MISRKQSWYNIMKNYDLKEDFDEKKQIYDNVFLDNCKQFTVEGKIKEVRFNNCVYAALIPTRKENEALELKNINSTYDNYNERHHIIKDLPNNIAELDIEHINSIKSSIKLPTIKKVSIQYNDEQNDSETNIKKEKNNKRKMFRFHDDILSYMIK
jgi:hypothetical protein